QFNDLCDRFEISRKQDDATGPIFPEEGSEFSRNGGAIEPYHEELADLVVRHLRTALLLPYRERLMRNWINSLVPMPVGPLGMYARSRSLQSVLAMSRCTHGTSPTNLLKKRAAVIMPPPRPPMFRMSATSLRSCSKYSSHNGISHTRSPARRPALRIASFNAASVPNIPIANWPSATTQAPVSVAMSMSAAGLNRVA